VKTLPFPVSSFFMPHQVIDAHIYPVAHVLKAHASLLWQNSCSESSSVSENMFLSGRGKGSLMAGGVMLVSAPWQDPEEHGGELGEGDHTVSQCLRRQPGHSLLPLAPLSFFPAL